MLGREYIVIIFKKDRADKTISFDTVEEARNAWQEAKKDPDVVAAYFVTDHEF